MTGHQHGGMRSVLVPMLASIALLTSTAVVVSIAISAGILRPARDTLMPVFPKKRTAA